MINQEVKSNLTLKDIKKLFSKKKDNNNWRFMILIKIKNEAINYSN
jgi:hypothetical protein